MSAAIIQYRTRPDAAEENRSLVEAVVKEVAETGGIQYAAFQHEDGVTFVHIAAVNAVAKLEELSSFSAFRQDLASRVEPGSRTATEVDVIGLAVQDTPLGG